MSSRWLSAAVLPLSALAAAPPGTAAAPVVPDDPGGAVRFTINATQDVRPISSYIYGMNGNQPNRLGITIDRIGGNRWTAYNWENNASNAGSDWFHQNDDLLSSSNTPGEAVRPSVRDASDRGRALIVTVPMAGYVAADKNGGGDVNQTPDYLQTRFKQSLPRKGSPFTLAPNAGDGFVYQDEFVNFVETSARKTAGQQIFYSLDNEPDLWAHTHARIHPNATTYAELRQRTIDYASAIKDAAPGALVFGAVNYGWHGYRTLQDAPDRAGRDFHRYFLEQMNAAEQTAGRRLVDVLDVHWYPEAQGTAANGSSQRIVFGPGQDDTSSGMVAARVQAARSLYDANYVEQSWITQFSTGGTAIRLLPRMQADVAAYYPGTKLAITEYNYGGGGHISGAIAQADALGAFGREGLFAANWWDMSGNADAFTFAAFDAFRNFDGAGGAFGDTSVAAATTDIAKTAVYASVDPDDPTAMVLVLINRTGTAMDAGLAVTHDAEFALAQVYLLAGTSPTIQRMADIDLTLTNALRYAMPAYSVTTMRLIAVPEPGGMGAVLLVAGGAVLRRRLRLRRPSRPNR
jgi:hypothetical protein